MFPYLSAFSRKAWKHFPLFTQIPASILSREFFFSLSLFLGNSGHIFGFIGTKLNEVENFPRRPDVMVQLKTVNGGELFRMVGSLLVKKKIVLL